MRLRPSRSAAHGSLMLRAAGRAVALAFRAVPKVLRFRAAVVLARWLEPLIKRIKAYEERRKLKVESAREISLDLLLLMLTRHGTAFDPVLRIEGLDHLPAPGRPALVLGAHTMLSTLLMRSLYDIGYDPLVISAEHAFPIAGTRRFTRTLSPSPTMLLTVARALKGGQFVVAAIDRGEPERRNAPFPTAGGTLLVSDALIRLAMRSGVPMVFLASRLDESSRVVCHLGAPSPSSAVANDIAADFARFVDAVVSGDLSYNSALDRCSPSPSATSRKFAPASRSTSSTHRC
jgi:hypothetical protein